MCESALGSSSVVLLDSTVKPLTRVLHIDDDTYFLKTAKQCLETQGPFQVDTACSVEEAQKKMKEHTYDAVISDYMMPGKDGLEFLKELRDSGNSVPFIMFTGKGREEVAMQALNLGADQYLNKNGDPASVYCELAHGIRQAVERKTAEAILQENKNYLQTILNSIFTGVVVINAETHEIVDANPKALETIGASRKQIVGKICNKFICPAGKRKCPITDLGQTVDKSERVLLKANGKRIPILKTVVPIIWKNHNYMVESFVDITEHKRSEKTLLKSEEMFKSLVEEAPIGVCNINLNETITYVNKRFEEATGYSRDEIVGKNGFKLGIMSDETSKLIANRMKKRLLGGPSRSIEGLFKRKDGEWIWAELEGRVIKRFGVPVGFQLTARDITERKKTESERKRFEESLAALNTYSRELNIAKSSKEVYRLTLDAMEKTLGFEVAFFMVVEKDKLRMIDHRGYPESFSTSLPLDGTQRGVSVKVARSGKSINVPDAEKDDAWVEFKPGIRSGLDVPVKIGNRVLGVIGVESNRLNAFNEKDQQLLEILASHAATALNNLEYARSLEARAREIQESQQKFERLFMKNPEAADYLDTNFHVLDVNPRFSEFFGYTLNEAKGKHINDLIVPGDKIEEAKMLDKKAGDGLVSHDTVRKRKDGTLVSVSISAAPIIVEGKLIGTVGLYKDITQLKKTEKDLREALKKLRIMSEKLSVVGRFTRHDVRNKLATILMRTYLAKKRLAENDELKEHMSEIESACEKAKRIFDFAGTYEKLGMEELSCINVDKTIREAIALFSDLKGVQIINKCDGLVVLADSLLMQVFYNLIDNSLKYGEKVDQINIYYEKPGKDRLKIIYRDNGVGIPTEMKSMLFKEGVGKGTGYGLYLIKKICEVYGWTIQETGEPNKGAEFTMTIPETREN